MKRKATSIPDFANEEQEAAWWAANPDAIAQEFEAADRDKALGRGSTARRGLTPTTTIRLDPADILRAKTQAQRKGLRYQTYLKMLIHEALSVEEPQGSRTSKSRKAS